MPIEPVQVQQTLIIPEQLMLLCPELPQPSSGAMPVLLANHVEVAAMYYQCAARHAALSQTIKEQTDNQKSKDNE